MNSLTALVVLALVVPLRVHAAPPPPVGVTLIPHGSTFPSFRDYAQTVELDRATVGKVAVTSAELEIRFPAAGQRVLRYPYLWDLGREVPDRRMLRVPNIHRDQLDEPALRRLNAAPPGDYQVALLVNGVRASNVVAIRIDPHYDPATAPVLALAPLEPHPLARRARLLVAARGPVPFDKEFTSLNLYCAPLQVDGVARRMANIIGMGVSGSIASGKYYGFPLDLAQYQPAIDSDRPHLVEYHFGPYAAAPLRFDPLARPLHDAWEAATAGLQDAPAPPISVEGTVRDTGQAAPVYRVTLTGPAATRQEELTDAQGRFQFPELPPATYTVHCAPLNAEPYGYSRVAPEAVTIEPGKSSLMTLQFRTWLLKRR